MTEDIQSNQTETTTTSSFIQWFQSSGGKLDSRCQIQSIVGMGRGMIATQPILSGETIFVIPRHLLLNLSTSTLSQRCIEQDPSLWNQILEKGWVALILAMMWENRRAKTIVKDANANDDADVSMQDINDDKPHGEQNWGPYFDILPTQFSTPMFWNSNQLKFLQATSIADKVAREEAETDYYQHALPFIRSLPQVFLERVQQEENQIQTELQNWYSLEMYHTMGSRILSRSFHIKSRKVAVDGKTVAMDASDDEDDDEAQGEVLEEEQGDNSHVVNDSKEEENDDDDDNNNEAEDEDHNLNNDDNNDDDDDDDDDDDEETENIVDISMTPMADMLNARFESDNARLFYKSHVLEMRATKDIAKDEQIFNTYADPPNSDLLRRYGHVDEPNSNDVVELEAKLVIDSAVDAIHKKVGGNRVSLETDMAERMEWACSSLGIDEVFILNYLFVPSTQPPHRPQPERPTLKQLKSAATGGGISEEMIALARIVSMPRNAFEKAKAKGKGPSVRVEAVEQHDTKTIGSGKPIQFSLCIAQIMIDAIDKKLNGYPNGANVKIDEDRLYSFVTTQQPPSSSPTTFTCENERKATIVRLGEKRVLLDQKRVLQYVVDRIHQAEKENNSSVKRKATGQYKTLKKSRR